MNAFQKLKSALSAKLTIADASTAIREAKAVLNDPTNSMEEGPASTAAKIWSEAKAGTLPKFMSSTEAKNVIALAAREANGGAPSTPPAVVPTPAAQAITKPAPAPAAATAPAKPAIAAPAKAATPALQVRPPAAPNLTTAAAFATPELNMARSEFDKLSSSDKARFFETGGKLVDDPENVTAALKARAEAAGVLKAPDTSKLTGMEKVSASMGFTSKRDAFFRAEAARMIHDEDMAEMKSGKGSIANGNNRAAASIDRDTRIAARAKQLAASLPL